MSIEFLTRAITLVLLSAVCLTGLTMLADYSSRPGPEVVGLPEVLDNDLLPGDTPNIDGSPTILLFYHPKCPCTYATARCLERLSTKFSTNPQIQAFAYCPANESDAWIESATTQTLAKLPEVQVVIDRNGVRCQRFGVVVSGHVLVYGVNGKLKFSGGLTPYRGHEGSSQSSSQFVSCVNGAEINRIHWPAFGCTIIEQPGEAKDD